MRKFILFLVDTALTFLAGLAALFMRFGFDFGEMMKYFPSIPIYTAVASIVYILNGNYRVVWAYASSKDMMLIFRGSFIAYLFNIAVFHLFLAPQTGIVLPRSVGFLTFLGSFTLIVMSRLFWQWYSHLSKEGSGEKRIVIIGAGDAGTMLLEEFERRPSLGKVVAFVDDSPRKIGRKIRGVPVYGPIGRIMEVVEKLNAHEVIIAIPSASSEQMRRIMESIDLRRVSVRTLPGIYELTDGKARIGQLREVSIEDLLGREQIKVNLEEIGKYIKGKRVMVTGAGGSIGSELVRQIARLKPKALILLGRGENSIYKIDEELSENFPDLEKFRVIGDVSDRVWMRQVFEKFKPQIVFHAAAHKHVHLMEENPYEAFRVNVVGTKVIAELCCEYKVERMIFISTDKAVNPTSIMGLSKRIAELFILYGIDCDTKFAVVRFGNVLGSRGSVIPKFKEQIRKGGPVTVTDPRMRRFFMSIPEAVSLVLQAGAYTNGKGLFVLDMGEQISIDKLARTLISLSGFVPDQDIKIVYTGIRPGEKLYEELFYPYEEFENTPHEKVMRVRSKRKFERVKEYVEEMEKLIREGNFEKALEIAKRLVPEYGGDNGVDGDERQPRQSGEGQEGGRGSEEKKS